MLGSKKPKKSNAGNDRLLPKLSHFFFKRTKITASIWIFLAVFGSISYTTLLKREGFPAINLPITFVSGTYFANDSAVVDNTVTKVIIDAALKQPDVSTVRGSSATNFFTIQIQYKEGVDAQKASKQLEQDVNKVGKLPASAKVQYDNPYFGATGGDILPIDVAVSYYSQDNTATTEQLVASANTAAKWLSDKHLSLVDSVFVKDPYRQSVDPSSGKAVVIQRNFDRFGVRQNNQTNYYRSVIIGLKKVSGSDVIRLDDEVRTAVKEMNSQPQFKGFVGDISASFAPSIKNNISELQRVLLEGLIAVLVIGSLVIAIRASLITVLSMITVLLITLGLLYLLGYTLNVITLFALILGLSLIVDDTIIMVEAIDAARKKEKDQSQVIKVATRKVSRAMVAATATAAACFAPLLFVSGVLGSFIRAIPITIIASLTISLLVSLIFIPFFAKFLLLGKKQMGEKGVKEISAKLEAKIAAFIVRPMLWARKSQKRLFAVGIVALVIGFVFIGAGLSLSSKVIFNIFPASKDTNAILLSFNFPPNVNTKQAEAVVAEADKLASDIIGDNFEQSSYFGTGSALSASQQIKLVSYDKRKATSPQLVKQLQSKFDSDFNKAIVTVSQIDLGPPGTEFTVTISSENRAAAYKLAENMQEYLSTVELKRSSGKIAHLTNVKASSPDQYLSTDGKSNITVSGRFDGDDTTTLVNLAKAAVNSKFDAGIVKGYGLPADAVNFDLGQESENQSSFKTLVVAFPILLLVMYLLLLLEFRSWLQPLLIFMAIPFSIFGVMLGLYLTNNAISFFAMLGFFALIGLSIKNTILLTDFANQSKHNGMGTIDSVVAALEERFRPLFATSATAVVALIPLSLSSPFWQGLAVVLIFGLLSSTLLVITVFPYYYLGAEFLRSHVSLRKFIGRIKANKN